MDLERMQHKGQLAEHRRKYSHLDLEAKGLIAIIRQFLNPYESDITKLRIEEAAVQMERLHKIHVEMFVHRKAISEMEEALDG